MGGKAAYTSITDKMGQLTPEIAFLVEKLEECKTTKCGSNFCLRKETHLALRGRGRAAFFSFHGIVWESVRQRVYVCVRVRESETWERSWRLLNFKWIRFPIRRSTLLRHFGATNWPSGAEDSARIRSPFSPARGSSLFCVQSPETPDHSPAEIIASIKTILHGWRKLRSS